MNEQQKQEAIKVLKNILHVLYEKRYEKLPSCVDVMEWEDDLEEVSGAFESFFETFEDVLELKSFDEGLKEENLQFEEFDNEFMVIYALTCGGTLVDWELRLMFRYGDEGMYSILDSIEYV